MSDVWRYTTWKVPAGWNELIEAWRTKHHDELVIRGVNSNSGAVLFILTRVMEAEGLVKPVELGRLMDFGEDFNWGPLKESLRKRE